MTPTSTLVVGDDRHTAAESLKSAIEHAAALLPIPGPISAFAFLNTLQALEDLPFDEGIKKGARLYGCQPYLDEDRYREKLTQGRIRLEDLSAVLKKDLRDLADHSIYRLATRFELRLAMLQHPLRSGPPEELRWFVAVTDALTHMRPEAAPAVRSRFIEETRHWIMRDLRFGSRPRALHGPHTRDQRGQHVLADIIDRFGHTSIETWTEHTWEALTLQALWRVCRDSVQGLVPAMAPPHPTVRHRDVLLEATGEDSDTLVHESFVRFCAAFTDQGFAHWPLPNREQGFYRAFIALYRRAAGPPDPWQQGLAAELERLESLGTTPLESIEQSLTALGVQNEERDEFLTATLLALRGWAGMLWQMETRGDRVPSPVPPGTLIEFLAIRLILDRLALSYIARQTLSYEGPPAGLRHAAQSQINEQQAANVEQRAFLVFQLAQLLGWSPPALYHLSKEQWGVLLEEIESFTSLDRRRLLHLAFERRFRVQTLDALSVHAARKPERVASPRFQAVFCLDAREESFRRHLEENAPDVETFGAAGFYGVAMYYRGAADAHFSALCPIVIKPQHWVTEEVVYSLEADSRRRAKTRRAIGTASHQVHVGSRSLVGGAVFAAGLGVLASVPLVARVLFPRLTAWIRHTAGSFVQPPPITRLRLERKTEKPGPTGDQIGYSLEEMAANAERQLRDIGLTSGFSRLVLFFGHGSFCLNNPHKSAYDCGACSGNPGGPNARALAVMLNDPRVREILASRGLAIPRDTWFIGGLHNTGKDAIVFYDLDLLPMSHAADFESARETLTTVCEKNAHERCRRFESADLDFTTEEAHEHVEERCEDLAQTRPEFGNASNAICIVGRRTRTRGLYLDRRCFLTSYDPTQDDADHNILARILAAAIPVCEGINMQYFLSYVDSPGWACGTKLPHNVTSLLAVMDGAASDLRPGLPWQSVEIHEPVRLLFVIEATPETMFSIMERNATVGRILRNGWAQLAVLDPDSSDIKVFRGGAFHTYRPNNLELPVAPTSADWYRGWRDHLEFAVIEKEPC
jgi:uncharacterized protein YbcC (UPF0753/DUF2309 family)